METLIEENILLKWEDLPQEMQIPEVQQYYEILNSKRERLIIKRCFDFSIAGILIILLSPIFIILSILIKIDSPGSIFYRQERISQYGKCFKIHKFRTMISKADTMGSQVTMDNDRRITRVGKYLRQFRLDEIPQLIDILQGTMSFVGTRPEVPKYVANYSSEMIATLLLPAGVTSQTSILFKDESKILNSGQDVDQIYVEQILPRKMFYNLQSLKTFSLCSDLGTLFNTIFAVFGKEYQKDEAGEYEFIQLLEKNGYVYNE